MCFYLILLIAMLLTSTPMLLMNLLFILGHYLERRAIEQEWKESQKKN